MAIEHAVKIASLENELKEASTRAESLERALRDSNAKIAQLTVVSGVEELKELNATIRQWETIMFATAKDYVTHTTLAVAAAGSVIAWSNVDWDTRALIAKALLTVGALLGVAGFTGVASQERYLSHKYDRRKELVQWGSKEPQQGVKKPGYSLTVWVLFLTTLTFSAACLAGIRCFPERPEAAFSHVRLADGTDISRLKGLTQDDFVDSCQMGKVSLPSTITPLPLCKQP